MDYEYVRKYEYVYVTFLFLSVSQAISSHVLDANARAPKFQIRIMLHLCLILRDFPV